MDWLHATSVLASFLAAFLATALALFAWQRRAAGWAVPFTVLMLAFAEWFLAYGLELSSGALPMVVFWAKARFVGVAVAPVAWFIFAVRYTGRERWLVSARRRTLYIIPLITILAAMSNEWHQLMWDNAQLAQVGPAFQLLDVTRGFWFWLHAIFSYLLVVAGIFLFLRALRQARGEYRWHTLVVFLGSGIPWLGNLVYVGQLSPVPQLDPTPFAFVLGGVLLVWGILGQHLFDLVPVARQTVLNSMRDGVLVVNAQERIVDVTPAGEAILGHNVAGIIGNKLVDIMPDWESLWTESVKKGEVQAEVTTEVDGEERCYDLRISPVRGGRRHVTGRLIVLRDITQHKKTETELVARQQLFENLVAVARATAEGPSLQATLQNALDVAAMLTGAEYGSLFLLDSEGRVAHSILARGKTAPISRREIVGTVMDKGLAGWAVRHRRPALIEDTLEDERWVTLPDQPYAVRSVLAVPITSHSKVPGVLTLQHSEPHHFGQEDEALLQAASDQMALALRNAQIYEEQRRLADRQQTLYEALRTIGKHLEPSTVVHLAVDTIARITDWPALAILVPTPDEEKLIVQAGTGLLEDSEQRSFGVDGSKCGRAFRTGETLSRTAHNSDEGQIKVFPQLRSTLFVPLGQGQQKLGVFVVGSQDSTMFGEEDILLAESLAETIALSMANAKLFQAVADEHSRLKALIESSRDGIILVGTEQQIMVVNHTALEFLGLQGGPEDWTHRPLADAFSKLRRESPEAVKAALSEMRHVNRDDQESREGELELRSRSLRWSNLPVSGDAAAVGRLIVLEDVTRERALQRMRDDLTHTMVHDLRNPLNIVSGSLDMLEDSLQSSPTSEDGQVLKIAKQSTERMLNMINGILSISRLESGRMPLNRTTVDVSEIVKSVFDAQVPLAREKDLQLEFAAVDDIPKVEVDTELVERVFQNLLGNAIKFTPSGGKIAVTLKEVEDDLHVAVSDSGPGIPQEISDQLFEKFVTGMQIEKGSGLGLAFCRMAVEAHGGQIWVESNPEDGATFHFTLPKRSSHRGSQEKDGSPVAEIDGNY
jgi:PAS domain S-box-containing protein